MAASPSGESLLRRDLRVPLPDRDVLWAALGLAALAAFLLREAVFGGRVFYERDLHLQWFGQVESFVYSVTSGSWPLWDPFVSFGQPLLANANNQIYYPPTWLHLLIRPWTYYTIYFLAHLIVGGVGLYRLALRLEVSRRGAFVAAALWVASGPLLSLGNAWNHLAAAAWMPWVGLAAVALVEQPRFAIALAWGAAWALQILAGSPDVFVMTGALALVLVATHFDWSRWRAGSHLLAMVVLATAFALALSAAQWVPSAEVALRSDRSSLDMAERTYWSIHPASLLQLIVPVWWYELPLKPEWRQALFESREPFLFSTYIGLPALILAAAAFVERRAWRVGILALAVAAVLVALGKHAPFYGAALWVLPPLRLLRFPAKGLVLAGFCTALLAGAGFDAWARPGGSGRGWRLVAALAAVATAVIGGVAATATWAPELLESGLTPPSGGAGWADLLRPTVRASVWAAVLGLALLVAAVARRRGARAASTVAGLLSLLAVGDLAWAHRNLNKTAPGEFFTLRPEVVGSIDQADRRRLFVYDYSMKEGRSRRYLKRETPYLVPGFRKDGPYEWAGAFGLRMYLVPPIGAAWRLFGSYEKDGLGLQAVPLAEMNAVLAYTDGMPLATRLLRLGAVSQVIALHTEGLSELSEVKTLPGPFLEPMHLFTVPRPLPRSYVVEGVRVADGHAALDTLIDPRFAPEAEVLLPAGPARRPDPDFAGDSRILKMVPDRVLLQVEASRDAHVVLVDAYDPGWRATVDGRPSEVLRANVGFEAVAIPAGRHVVELVYRPPAVVWGLAVSAATVIAALVVLLGRRRDAGERA
jgi:Bacterial membrane protein YfhO